MVATLLSTGSAAGANLRELMERMGHTSTRAALIYLLSTCERQHTLADAVGKLARTQMGQVRKSATGKGVSGTKVARPPARAS